VAPVMDGEEFTGRMAKLLESVPGEQREILHLRVVLGLSAEETAEVTGSTPCAVRTAQHRALNRLRDLLTAQSARWCYNESNDGKQPQPSRLLPG
jgi:DNA-directed RNA polymerase specialized sigma24 family protein